MNFPVEDITHHSKRTQEENLRLAGVADTITTVCEEPTVNGGVPQSVTLESAITYFRANAKGDTYKLFMQTADWLDKYRVASRTAMNKLLKEAQAEEAEDSETLTVDMNEVK